MPGRSDDVRFSGADRKSAIRGQTDAIDPTRTCNDPPRLSFAHRFQARAAARSTVFLRLCRHSWSARHRVDVENVEMGLLAATRKMYCGHPSVVIGFLHASHAYEVTQRDLRVDRSDGHEP